MTYDENEVLRITRLKLEARRDELMDIISSSISSVYPNRVDNVYDATLELATIEKALELNKYFQLQVQESHLRQAKTLNEKGGTRTASSKVDDEELKK